MDIEQFKLHRSIEMKHWWFLARRTIIREILHEISPPNQGNTVIDYGCGTGGNAVEFADEYNVTAIDSSVDAIHIAKTIYPNKKQIFHHSSEETICEEIQKKLASANIVLLLDVLEHMPEDIKAVSTILNLVSSGCYILITVPADMSLWSPHDESFGHYRRYTLESLQSTWQDFDVNELFISYFNSRLYPLIKIIRTLNRFFDSTSGLAGTDVKMPNHIINKLLCIIFAGESRVLKDVLHQKRKAGFLKGASLIAIIRKS